jgi:hypothetical protein
MEKQNRGVRGSYINKTMICPDDGDSDTAQHDANDSEQMPTRWRSADYDQMTLSSSRWSRKMPSRTPAKTACVAFVSCAKILCVSQGREKILPTGTHNGRSLMTEERPRSRRQSFL